VFNNFRSRKYVKPSFSQNGEDLIVNFIFSTRGVTKPSFVDIGAHHPYYLSNTALFYNKGCRGINIEPDPELFSKLKQVRKRDINLNIGIGIQMGEMDFYFLSSPTMNTFSKEEANKLVCEYGMRIRQILPVPVNTLPNIIQKYWGGKFPDFLSLDVEGLDFEILTTIDYRRTYPTVICVETISYSTTGKGSKALEIIDFLQKNDYILYADTYINSIFVKRAFWER
jgi:FkbM family methyltransferase